MPATQQAGSAPFVPDAAVERRDLDALRSAAAGCQGCDLHRDATQTVFGAGPTGARLLLVGEQPGDQEDRAGEPFVGPAGRILDQALDQSGIDRDDAYVTNAVKHFRFVRAERGKRRLHKSPNRGEIVACRPWLVAELRAVRPEFLVLLGAVAAKAVLGPSFRLTEHRGRVLELDTLVSDDALGAAIPARGIATVHPSAVLRATDREAMVRGLVADLRVARDALGES